MPEQGGRKFFDLSAARAGRPGGVQLASMESKFMPLSGYSRLSPSSPRKLSAEKQDAAHKVDKTALEILFPELREEKTSLRQEHSDTQKGWLWPVAESMSTRISSPFGQRKDPFTGKRAFHKGIDIAAPLGTEVMAYADGVVESVAAHPRLGNYVKLLHEDDAYTLYGHLSAASVKKGEKVRAGEALGKIGSTGRSTGPHLDFSLRKHGVAVNPLPHLAVPDYMKAVEISHARN